MSSKDGTSKCCTCWRTHWWASMNEIVYVEATVPEKVEAVGYCCPPNCLVVVGRLPLWASAAESDFYTWFAAMACIPTLCVILMENRP